MSPQLQHPRSETLREPRKPRDKHLSKSAASQQKGGKAASGVYVPRSHSLTNKILQRASTETLARVDLAVKRLQVRSLLSRVAGTCVAAGVRAVPFCNCAC